MSKDLFEALTEVMDSWGVCSICDGEHAWANLKCDLLFEPVEDVFECVDEHFWIGVPLYCSACGVDKGEERVANV